MKLAISADEFTKGTTILYNDGRPGHTSASATVLETSATAMIVQFSDRADPTKIKFNDPQWMDHITILR